MLTSKQVLIFTPSILVGVPALFVAAFLAYEVLSSALEFTMHLSGGIADMEAYNYSSEFDRWYWD
jgi:hypothetical protein